MDEDGSVYMQVINRGDMDNRAKADDLVYFRFMRYNLHTYAATGELEKELNNSENGTSDAFELSRLRLRGEHRCAFGLRLDR